MKTDAAASTARAAGRDHCASHSEATLSDNELNRVCPFIIIHISHVLESIMDILFSSMYTVVPLTVSYNTVLQNAAVLFE